MKHLRYEYQKASYAGDNRNAWTVMRELGVTWAKAVPQTLGDQVWFLNCENVPEALPEWISDLDEDYAAPWLAPNDKSPRE